jgi:hypothetical protein
MARVVMLILFALMTIDCFVRSITPYSVYVKRRYDIALARLKNYSTLPPREQRLPHIIHLVAYALLTLVWAFALYAVWLDVWP